MNDIENKILEKLDVITGLLGQIILAMGKNRPVNDKEKARYEISVEHSAEPTRNANWMKVRGKFQQPNRKYPDWITLFVKAKDSEIINKGQTLAVVGELREAESQNGKPLFSLFAESIEVVSEAEQPGQQSEPESEQFNTKGNYDDEEVPF